MLLINKRISMYLSVENLDRKGTPASIKKERGKKSSNNFHRLFPLETKISHKSSRSSFSFPLRQSERKCVTLKRFWGDSRIRFFNQFLFWWNQFVASTTWRILRVCVYYIDDPLMSLMLWAFDMYIIDNQKLKILSLFAFYRHMTKSKEHKSNFIISLRKAWKRVRCS